VASILAVEHGLIVKKGVAKDLDFLVAADPDSMSGKAKKAREYGI
jgi:DNA polymerase-3 subunit epsilon